jgi:integrase/recombinase XerC
VSDAAASAARHAPASAAVAQYLEHLRVERRLAARTLALYADALARLEAAAEVQQVALDAVEAAQVRRWVAMAHRDGLAPRSLALLLSAWRGFYKWWAREAPQRIRLNPADGVRAPKAAKPLPKALSVDHAVALAEHVGERGTPAQRARDRAMVELLYGCGLRVGELCALDVRPGAGAAGWIDAADATAHVLGKGSKRRSVPVGRAALAALDAWLAQRPSLAKPDEPALFVGARGARLGAAQVRARLKAIAVAAGVPAHVHPHMLRHSYASHLLQSSGDLRAVQELLGHANITTTQVYTKLDFQHLAKAYDAAHPRARKRG